MKKSDEQGFAGDTIRYFYAAWGEIRTDENRGCESFFVGRDGMEDAGAAQTIYVQYIAGSYMGARSFTGQRRPGLCDL